MHFKAILFTQQTPQAPSYYCTDISTTPQRYKNKWFGSSRSIIIPLNVLTGGRERTYDLPLAICVRHLDKSQARWYIFVPGRRKDRDRWSFESLHELPRLYFEWVIYITSYYNRRSIFAPPPKKKSTRLLETFAFEKLACGSNTDYHILLRLLYRRWDRLRWGETASTCHDSETGYAHRQEQPASLGRILRCLRGRGSSEPPSRNRGR